MPDESDWRGRWQNPEVLAEAVNQVLAEDQEGRDIRVLLHTQANNS